MAHYSCLKRQLNFISERNPHLGVLHDRGGLRMRTALCSPTLTQLLDELGVRRNHTSSLIDNHSTIKQIENIDSKRRSKPLDIKYHYIREQFQYKLFRLESVPSQDQFAEQLTKPLSGPQLERLVSMANAKTIKSKRQGQWVDRQTSSVCHQCPRCSHSV